jgi:hypothetical protein
VGGVKVLYQNTAFVLVREYGQLKMEEGVSELLLSCKANARVKLAKTRHGPHYSTLVVILLFVFFYVLFVCESVVPPGDNPIAVNKYIKC